MVKVSEVKAVRPPMDMLFSRLLRVWWNLGELWCFHDNTGKHTGWQRFASCRVWIKLPTILLFWYGNIEVVACSPAIWRTACFENRLLCLNVSWYDCICVYTCIIHMSKQVEELNYFCRFCIIFSKSILLIIAFWFLLNSGQVWTGFIPYARFSTNANTIKPIFSYKESLCIKFMHKCAS